MLLALPACQQGAKKLAKEVAQGAGEEVAEKATKELVQDASEEATEVALRKFFSSSIVEKTGLSPELQKQLVRDMVDNPALAKTLRSNPGYLRSYKMLAESKVSAVYTGDAKLLKWMDDAWDAEGSYQRAFGFRNIKEALQFENKSDRLIIRNAQGKELGSYSRGVLYSSSRSGMHVRGNLLMNMPLLSNSIYRIDNRWLYQTDDLGRVLNVKGMKPLELLSNTRRDQTTQGWAAYLNDPIWRQGYKGKRDQAGHLIGRRFGGAPEILNYVPMHPDLNTKSFKSLENEWERLITKGHKVVPALEMRYAGKSRRPVSIKVSYSVDGGRPISQTFLNPE